MTWMLLPMAVMTILHVGVFGKALGRLSPSSVFVYMQFVMAVGALPMLEPQHRADNAHGWLILGTFTLFWVTSTVLASADLQYLKDNARSRSAVGLWVAPTRPITMLLAVSVLVCLIYYAAIGYNVLGVALMNAFDSGADDITSLRFGAYSGGKYFYPGYVNQFKNALLPALVCVIVPYFFVQRINGRIILSSILVLVAMVFILGTGQRGAFVTFMIAVVVFMAIMNRRRLSRRMLWVASAALPVFFLSTFALGRSSNELARSSGLIDQLIVIGGEVIFRILGSNQEAAVSGFRYIYAQPSVGGLEWLESFRGLLPGVSGSTLSNEIFAQLYGSFRGTAPPSIWGSTFHNFGLIGTLVFSVILAIVYHLVGRKIRLKGAVNSMQAIGMGGVTTVLGTWVAGSPDYFLNAGLVVYIFLWIGGGRLVATAPGTKGLHSPEFSSKALGANKETSADEMRLPITLLGRPHKGNSRQALVSARARV